MPITPYPGPTNAVRFGTPTPMQGEPVPGHVLYVNGDEQSWVHATPDEAGLVAKSGNQTNIGGNKTFTGAVTIASDVLDVLTVSRPEGDACRIVINGGNNAGFTLKENGVTKWTVASYSGGTFTLWNDSLGGEALGITAANVGTFNGKFNVNTFRVATSQTPASATATGTAGDIAWDANYVYVCTATNTWKRAALSTW